jgi:valyl-tRNA synthetase
MLANPDFCNKAPEPVVQRQRDRLAEQQERRQRLEARLAALEG